MTLFANPGLVEKVIDGIGGVVDDAFLTLPKILKPFKPKRVIDQKTYARQVEYYFDHHFIDQPETFFSLPEILPKYSVTSEILYADGGFCQEIIFPSQYAPKNPLIADRFLSFPENKTARLVRWAHGDEGRKTLVCLHGYMLGDPAQAERMFKVKTLYQMGLDVALFVHRFTGNVRQKKKYFGECFFNPMMWS